MHQENEPMDKMIRFTGLTEEQIINIISNHKTAPL
jgi:hypothetical protein